jgi:hypothetical protein
MVRNKANALAAEHAAKERREKSEKRKISRLKKARVDLALKGVRGLCKIGKSKEFQEFLAARKAPLNIWGGESGYSTTTPGYDMASVFWKTTGFISIGADEVKVVCKNEVSGNGGADYKPDFGIDPWHDLSFPYSEKAPFQNTRKLLRLIATAKSLNLLEITESQYDFHGPETLFEVLVLCASPKERKNFVLNAMD